MKLFLSILFSSIFHLGIFIKLETANKKKRIATISIKISQHEKSTRQTKKSINNNETEDDSKLKNKMISSQRKNKQQNNKYVDSVIRLIEQNKFYPLKAKRLKQKGKVIISFQINEDGTYRDLKIENPSPFESLNNSAIQIIKDIKQFPPPPQSISSKNLYFQIPIEYI